ncbi:hypothetical protein TNCT1_61450 [Streptomyces sp. 1-11]|nr:hypothetical protein TNCT1_61450 [Streptomyces sp. 1-11]
MNLVVRSVVKGETVAGRSPSADETRTGPAARSVDLSSTCARARMHYGVLRRLARQFDVGRWATGAVGEESRTARGAGG